MIEAPALPASSANSSRDSSARSALVRPAPERVFQSSPTRMARSAAASGSPVFLCLRGVRVYRYARSVAGRCAVHHRRRTARVGVRRFLGHHRRDGVLENQLLLIIGFEHSEYLSKLLIRPESLTPLIK